MVEPLRSGPGNTLKEGGGGGGLLNELRQHWGEEGDYYQPFHFQQLKKYNSCSSTSTVIDVERKQ